MAELQGPTGDGRADLISLRGAEVADFPEYAPRVRFGDGDTDTMLLAAAEKFLGWMYEHDRPGFARVMCSAVYGVDLRAPVKRRGAK